MTELVPASVGWYNLLCLRVTWR